MNQIHTQLLVIEIIKYGMNIGSILKRHVYLKMYSNVFMGLRNRKVHKNAVKVADDENHVDHT